MPMPPARLVPPLAMIWLLAMRMLPLSFDAVAVLAEVGRAEADRAAVGAAVRPEGVVLDLQAPGVPVDVDAAALGDRLAQRQDPARHGAAAGEAEVAGEGHLVAALDGETVDAGARRVVALAEQSGAGQHVDDLAVRDLRRVLGRVGDQLGERVPRRLVGAAVLDLERRAVDDGAVDVAARALAAGSDALDGHGCGHDQVLHVGTARVEPGGARPVRVDDDQPLGAGEVDQVGVVGLTGGRRQGCDADRGVDRVLDAAGANDGERARGVGRLVEAPVLGDPDLVVSDALDGLDLPHLADTAAARDLHVAARGAGEVDGRARERVVGGRRDRAGQRGQCGIERLARPDLVDGRVVGARAGAATDVEGQHVDRALPARVVGDVDLVRAWHGGRGEGERDRVRRPQAVGRRGCRDGIPDAVDDRVLVDERDGRAGTEAGAAERERAVGGRPGAHVRRPGRVDAVGGEQLRGLVGVEQALRGVRELRARAGHRHADGGEREVGDRGVARPRLERGRDRPVLRVEVGVRDDRARVQVRDARIALGRIGHRRVVGDQGVGAGRDAGRARVVDPVGRGQHHLVEPVRIGDALAHQAPGPVVPGDRHAPRRLLVAVEDLLRVGRDVEVVDDQAVVDGRERRVRVELEARSHGAAVLEVDQLGVAARLRLALVGRAALLGERRGWRPRPGRPARCRRRRRRGSHRRSRT